MAVSKRLRYEIFRRDNHACRYCGASAPDVPLRIDHVTPVALGGTDVPENLVTACEPCNSGKTSTNPDAPLVANVAQDALRWSQAMQHAASVLAAKDGEKLAYRAAFEEAWNSWTATVSGKKQPLALPNEWKQSVERFRLAGLPASSWEEIVDIAMSKPKVTDTFRYMCGVAWRQVDELQVIAREHLAEQDGMDPQTPPSEASQIEAVVWSWAASLGDPGAEGWPDAERIAAFRASVPAAMEKYHLPLVINGAEHAAWYEDTQDNLEAGIEAFKKYERDMSRYVACEVWDYAYGSSCGEYPSAERTKEFWKQCEALYEAGLQRQTVLVAAAVAGTHLAVTPHYGIPRDVLDAQGIQGSRQYAEDSWAQAWFLSSPARTWPTDDERACFRAALDRSVARGPYTVSDVVTAAASAGTYQDTVIDAHLPCRGSVLKAAELCGTRVGA